MEGVLRTLRWTLAVRALLAIVIGIGCVYVPGSVGPWLMPAFGGYAVVDGLLILTAAAVLRWPSLLLQAFVSLAFGFTTLISPDWLTTVGILPIGAWGFATGLLQVLAACRLREIFRGEWLLAAAGVVTAAAGATLIALTVGIGRLFPPMPYGPPFSQASFIAAWALVSGVIMLGLVWRLTRTSVRM